MKFTNIPQFTKATHHTDVPFENVAKELQSYIDMGLQMFPDFQRGNVWSQEQQERFVEFLLRGGKTSDILFNNPNWLKKGNNSEAFVLVDGLQRLTAITKFLNNELKVFGHYRSEFEDAVPFGIGVRFSVNTLKTRKEVLSWYVDLNDGGTVHSKEEINRVKSLIEQEG